MDQQHHQGLMTNLVIGAPVKATRKSRLKNLSKMLSDLEEVREAHLPQVVEIGSEKSPQLVFFVVIDPETAIPRVMETIHARLKSILRSGESLDVRPLSIEHELLPAIRTADCVVGWRD